MVDGNIKNINKKMFWCSLFQVAQGWWYCEFDFNGTFKILIAHKSQRSL